MRRKECRQHHDGMRSDYGIVGCHVGIVWIFTVFWWKSCRNYWRFASGLDCMELKMNEQGRTRKRHSSGFILHFR